LLVDQEKSTTEKKVSYMQRKVGTASYWAPEIANETWIGPKVDIWSYGIVLHEMAVGYKPVKGT
jgi:serine/threonine protein kinase